MKKTKNNNMLKDQSITIRCTAEQKNQLQANASKLGMPLTTYACDKLFNGKERTKYARRKMCTTLVTVNHYLDQIYDLIERSDSDCVKTELLLPLVDNSREEYAKLWKY